MDLFGEPNQEIFNLFDDDVPPPTNTNASKKATEKAKKKNSKVDYTITMEHAPKTPFKCKNHETVHMRVRDYQKTSLTCGSCGFKL